MPAARHSVEIDASPEEVMAAICDFESYPNFLPEMSGAEVLRTELIGGEHPPGTRMWEVRFTVRYIRQLVYTLRLVSQGEDELSWSLLEGVFRSNDGGWRLESLDGGSRTRAHYRIDVQLEAFVPRSILRSLVDAGLPETLGRFKAEIEGHRAAGDGAAEDGASQD